MGSYKKQIYLFLMQDCLNFQKRVELILKIFYDVILKNTGISLNDFRLNNFYSKENFSGRIDISSGKVSIIFRNADNSIDISEIIRELKILKHLNLDITGKEGICLMENKEWNPLSSIY